MAVRGRSTHTEWAEDGTSGGGPVPSPGGPPDPKEKKPKTNPKHTCADKAARTFLRDFAIGEAAGAIGGGVVGFLVGVGGTVATDTYPFAGQTIPSATLSGAIVGAFDALPLTTLAASIDSSITYLTCH